MLFAQCSIRIFVFQTALSISYIGVVKHRKIRDPPPRGIVKSELVEIHKNNIDCWLLNSFKMASDEENMNSEEVSVIISNYLEIGIKKSRPPFCSSRVALEGNN